MAMKEAHFALGNRSEPNAARVLSETKQAYQVGTSDGNKEIIRKKYGASAYFVGDIVRIGKQKEHLVAEELLERRTVIAKAANQTLKDDHRKETDQILATNVDQLFVLIAVDQNFSMSKIERFILIFQQEMVDMWVILTKKDLKSDIEQDMEHLKSLYPQIHFLAISLYDEASLLAFQSVLINGKIGLLIGASGAGKSSLLNYLMGVEEVKTNQVRKDRKGKHTTTTSVFHELRDRDYYLIDSPGFKGIDSHHEVDASVLFSEIVELSKQCKFSNCQHQTEPGCAVKSALQSGQLAQEKWERYVYQASKIATFTSRGKRRK